MLIIRDNLYRQTLSDLVKKDNEWDGHYFDLRGQCSDHEFPGDSYTLGQVLGSILTLKTFKNCGDCHWRLHLKKKGASSVYLKIKDVSSGMTFKFRAPTTKDGVTGITSMSVSDAIAFVAFDKFYVGAYRSDFKDINYTVIENSIEQYSTVELLEEINARQKRELPDWSQRLTKGKDKQKEFNKLFAA